MRGRAVYPYATLKALLRWHPARFEVTIDGTAHSFVGYNVVVANTPVYGGGMRVAPGAVIDDGLFQVVAIGHIGRVGFLRQAPKVFVGTHVEHPAVSLWTGIKVEVEADRPFTVVADGEAISSSPAVVTIRPAALDVIAP